MFSRTIDAIQDAVDERAFGTGAQFCAFEHDVQLVNASFGHSFDGTEVTTKSLFHGYCCTKPIVAMAVMATIERHAISLDEPVGRFLTCDAGPQGLRTIPAWATSPTLTVRSVLAHSSGLDRPGAAELLLQPPTRHGEMIGNIEIESGPAYSEYLGGLTADWLVRSLGENLTSRLSETVTSSRADGLVYFEPTYAEVSERLIPPVGGLPVLCIPLLSEMLPSALEQICPAFGGLVTAAGLAKFYSAVGRVLSGELIAGFPSGSSLDAALSHSASPAYDRALRRMAHFACGFMLDLRNGSNDVIGHYTGYFPTFGFLDKQRGISIGFTCNGLNFSQDLQFFRGTLLRLMKLDIEDIG